MIDQDVSSSGRAQAQPASDDNADFTSITPAPDVEHATRHLGEKHGLGPISRIASRNSMGSLPDGGLVAWMQSLSGHLVIMSSWGFINSFGTFQTYYKQMMPEKSASDISFIGSINVFLLFFLGTFTGRLTDAGYFRPIFLFGSIAQVGGIIAVSFCTKYWQFVLAQGLCVGFGNGCLFCPAMTLVTTYFQKKRALAIGFTACGSVTGGIIFPIMCQQLLGRIGFPWTMRAIALVQLVALAMANLMSRPRFGTRKQGPLIELRAFLEVEYACYAAAAFSFFWGVYFAFYYLAAFSREALKDPFSFKESLNLLLILNGVGFVGRIIPNQLADRFGAINVFIPICGASSFLVYCWMAVDTSAGLYAWSVIYGIISAGVQSLFPAALSFLTTDMNKIGVRFGMILSVVAFAVLSGPVICGAIIDGSGGYKGAQAFSGTCLAMGTAFLTACKVANMRRTGTGWTGKI